MSQEPNPNAKTPYPFTETIDARIRANAHKYRILSATLVAALLQSGRELDGDIAAWGVGILEAELLTPDKARRLLEETVREELGVEPMPDNMVAITSTLPSDRLLEAWASIADESDEDRMNYHYANWVQILVKRMMPADKFQRSEVVKIATAQISAAMQTVLEGIAAEDLHMILPDADETVDLNPSLQALAAAELEWVKALHAVAMEEKDETSLFATEPA